MPTKDRSATAIRFPTELHEQLREASEAHGLPVNYLVVKAVQEFLADLLPPEELRLTRRHSGDRTV
jgi:predicted DNA-binding protein